MIWLGLVVLAIVAMTPLAFSLRRDAAARGRREAAVALHRAQLDELDRDQALGRIGPAEHATALLEVQRRLLAADAAGDPALNRTGRGPMLALLLIVPVAGFLLYITGGSPFLPAAPLADRLAQEQANAREADDLIAQLRRTLATLPPSSEQARQGYILLGNAEARRGNMPAAAEAWGTALRTRFEPVLAVETAEAISEASGRVTPEAAGLFRRALDAGPSDAPWRAMAEKRLAEAGTPPR